MPEPSIGNDFVKAPVVRWRQLLLAWLVSGSTLLLTGLFWHASNRDLVRDADTRFANGSNSIVQAVQNRMQNYEQVLRGGVGLFHASGNVTRKEWHDYVLNAEIERHFPGIQNMAVSMPVPAAQKEAHIAAVRAEGFPDYTIKPALPERELYHTLVYVEPFSERNLRAFGFDMYTNPVRKLAMDRAIDLGLPSISGAVKLVQETNQDVQHGFIFCLPAYKKPANTTALRRAALMALVCGAFRSNDLMHGIFGSGTPQMELEIFDAGQLLDERRMYSSIGAVKPPASRFVSLTPITVGGQTWLLRITAKQVFLNEIASQQGTVILIAGGGLSLALFAVIALAAQRQSRAQTLAQAMTRDLYDREAHFARFFASSSEAIVGSRADGSICDWNPAAERIFGHPASAVLGKKLCAVLSCADPALEPALLARLERGETIEHFEATYTRPDGSQTGIAGSISQQYDTAGNIIGTIRIMRDISAQKIAEKELEEVQYRMRQWVDDLPIGLFVVDVHGKPHYTNHRALQILGRGVAAGAGPEQLAETYQVYLSGTDQLYPTDRLPVIRALAGETCSVDDIEVQIDGQRRKLQVWGQPVYTTDGSIAYGVAAFEDITARKEVERLKKEFVSTVSHELRTPVTAIRGALGLILGGLGGSMPKPALDLVTLANNNCVRLVKLLNDILDIEKLEAGKLALDIKRHDLVALARQAVDNTQAFATQLEVRYEFEANSGALFALSDFDRTMQVLVNLLSNAAKFSQPGQVVAINVTQLEPGQSGAPGLIEVSVRDQGSGIPESFRPRIFQKFAQADSSDNRKLQSGSTGLGLSIAKAIIDQQGGQIGFESEEGHGSRFYFQLKQAPDVEVAAASPAQV